MVCPVCASVMSSCLSRRPGLSVVGCPSCGFRAADLAEWQYPYSERDYYAVIDPASVQPDRPSIRHRARRVRHLVASGRAVDLGCGLGETVLALTHLGFIAEGVEESPNAIRFLSHAYPEVLWHRKRVGVFLCESPDRHYDLVTMYHVLEHIPRPEAFVPQLARILRSGGWLVVEVPDVSGGQARLRGWNWHHWIPHHVNYFNVYTLRRLLEPQRFKLRAVEAKYHSNFPQGIAWRDAIHAALAFIGLHDVITTYWQKMP